jgi:hypothetical protein
LRQKTLRFGPGFRVMPGNRGSQAAEMVPPGGAEGGSDNRHRGADQWLFVVEGRGEAVVNGKRRTGRALLRTLNCYVPPAYRRDGDPLPRGRK